MTLEAEDYARQENQRADISRRQMKEINVSNRRMNADGGAEARDPSNTEHLPQAA